MWIRGADTGTVDAALAQLWDSWQTLSGASGGVGLMAAPALAGGRLIIAPTGPLWRERDDVRRFAKAGADGLARAAGIGAARPLLLVTGIPAGPKYKYALAVAALAAQASCWVPLEGREANNISSCVSEIGLTCIDDDARPEAWEAWLNAVENGRWLARDLCGTEPERMAPLRFAHDCEQVFASTSVRVETIYSGPAFAANYPLLNAVARASLTVPRHHPCVVRLEYKPQGPVERTLLFAGKGVTYDTGGADLKTGGSMAGMSRDKGGAAAVAGLMRTIAELAPPGIHAIAELGLVT